MNSEPRRTLRNLIIKYGLDLCSDVKRCQGLLRDLCGTHQREVNILIGALRERVPLDLLAGRTVMPHGMLMARLTKRLEDQLGLTDEAARWGVESWALALGIVTDDELEEIRKRSAEATQTPAPKADDQKQPRQAPPLSQTQSTTPHRGQQTPAGTQPTTPRQRANTPLSPPPMKAPTTPRTSAPPVHQQPGGGRTTPTRPSSTQGVPQQPEPPMRYDTRRRGGSRLRGCMIGCLLLIIVSSMLLFGVPYVVSLLREEQRQQTNEPPRIP